VIDDRVPPSSLEAEQAVIGSCLVNREAIETAASIVQPKDFYRSAHHALYEVVLAMADRDEPVDLLTLREELTKLDVLENIGGVPYLFQLQNAVPSAANVRYYAEIVKGKKLRRNLIDAANKLTEAAFNGEIDDKALTAEAGKIVENSLAGVSEQDYDPIDCIVAKAFEKIEAAFDMGGALTGVPTGLFDVDKATAGWQPGELILVAARPGVGKTAAIVNTFTSAALDADKRVVIFSLEMTGVQLMMRRIAAQAQVPGQQMARGVILDSEWKRIGEACAKESAQKIDIIDNADITIQGMRSILRKIQRTKGKPDIVMIDYLALISSEGHTDKEHLRIGALTRSLKKLAKEFKLPVILAAQVNKDVDRRGDGRPVLADVKEAGEADADIVMFLWPDKKQPQSDKERHVWLTIAKNRNGPMYDVPLLFNGELTTFEEVTGFDVVASTSKSIETARQIASKDSQEDSTDTSNSRIDEWFND